MRFQAHKNRNVARCQCSGQAVQIVPLAVIQQGVGRCTQQMSNPLCYPAGLGALIGSGKEPQFSREGLRGQQWAALPIVVQKAAGHIQYALAGTEALPKAEDVQPRPAGAQTFLALARNATESINGLIRVANAEKSMCAKKPYPAESSSCLLAVISSGQPG